MPPDDLAATPGAQLSPSYQWRWLARAARVRGRTAFRLRTGAGGLVRVLLRRDRHGRPLAISRPVRVKSGEPAADPVPAP